MRFLKKIKKNEGNQDVIENLEEILSNIDQQMPFEIDFLLEEKIKKFMSLCDVLLFRPAI